jgi:hypothetical protein
MISGSSFVRVVLLLMVGRLTLVMDGFVSDDRAVFRFFGIGPVVSEGLFSLRATDLDGAYIGGRSSLDWRLRVGVPTTAGGGATEICDSADELPVARSAEVGKGKFL